MRSAALAAFLFAGPNRPESGRKVPLAVVQFLLIIIFCAVCRDGPATIPIVFIGHFAVGFAAKRFAPRTSLAALLAAPLFLDLLWPWFLLFGWERVRIDPGNTRFTPLDLVYYPWSHSLLMSVAWATAFALIYHLIAHYWPGTLAIWIGVVSHWVLDWITHRPDMPLYPGGPRYGLALGTQSPAPWWWRFLCLGSVSGCMCEPPVPLTV